MAPAIIRAIRCVVPRESRSCAILPLPPVTGSALPRAKVSKPSTREISNLICAQDQLLPNLENTSDFLWQWGQFLDHDIDLVSTAVPAEPFNIPVPLGDPYFDSEGTGTQVIELGSIAFQMIHVSQGAAKRYYCIDRRFPGLWLR